MVSQGLQVQSTWLFGFRLCRLQGRSKSTSGMCQFLGRSLVSWSSKKQNCVALSTAEAEYVAAGACCAQLLWMKQTLKDFGCQFTKIPLLYDNESAIKLANNPIAHSRTKHIDIHHHFLGDHKPRLGVCTKYLKILLTAVK